MIRPLKKYYDWLFAKLNFPLVVMGVLALSMHQEEKSWCQVKEDDPKGEVTQTHVLSEPKKSAILSDGFRQLLASLQVDISFDHADGARDAWASAGRVTTADMLRLQKLLFRLRQTDTQQLDLWTHLDPPLSAWLKDPQQHQGELAWIVGKVISLEILESQNSAPGIETLYRCQMELGPEQIPAVVISPQVPKVWLSSPRFPQPVGFRGLFLKKWPVVMETSSSPLLLLLTTHLAWLPTDQASMGQQFLSTHGMDISLLDQVQQRRPFAKASVDGESAAFYACLRAVQHAKPNTLSDLTRQQLPTLISHWRQVLQESQTAQRTALAATVLKRATQGYYSVAPLYLEPETQVGQLTRIEGIARRAVKILVPKGALVQTKDWIGVMRKTNRTDTLISKSEHPGKLKNSLSANPAKTFDYDLPCYYELEIFTADSQNLPVVCCVCQLPKNFPLGDTIREPVRVAGIFFKSWLYRTRQTASGQQYEKNQRLPVPLVIGKQATWQQLPTTPASRWSLLAGISFLVILAILWGIFIARARNARFVTIDQRNRRLPASHSSPPRFDDL